MTTPSWLEHRHEWFLRTDTKQACILIERCHRTQEPSYIVNSVVHVKLDSTSWG